MAALLKLPAKCSNKIDRIGLVELFMRQPPYTRYLPEADSMIIKINGSWSARGASRTQRFFDSGAQGSTDLPTFYNADLKRSTGSHRSTDLEVQCEPCHVIGCRIQCNSQFGRGKTDNGTGHNRVITILTFDTPLELDQVEYADATWNCDGEYPPCPGCK